MKVNLVTGLYVHTKPKFNVGDIVITTSTIRPPRFPGFYEIIRIDPDAKWSRNVVSPLKPGQVLLMSDEELELANYVKSSLYKALAKE